MAAEQAVKLTDRNVIVLQTRTIPQGITAMLAFDESSDFSTNGVNMTKALDNVGSGSITFAVRDSDFEGKQIKKGEILAMENGKRAFVEKDVTKSLIKITKKLIRSGLSLIHSCCRFFLCTDHHAAADNGRHTLEDSIVSHTACVYNSC